MHRKLRISGIKIKQKSAKETIMKTTIFAWLNNKVDKVILII